MPDLTVTPASVVPGANAVIDRTGNAGETVTAGMGVYRKSADNRWWKAQSDGTPEEAGVGVDKGICLHAASAGQPLAVQTDGTLTIGATVAAGIFYFVSAAAGGICLSGDLVSTNKVTCLGYGLTTGTIQVKPIATGVVLA